MATQEISNLYELEQIAASLADECRFKQPDKYAAVSQVLFRGHSKASWNLDTTLERFDKKNLDLKEYIRYLSKVKPGIEAYTERAFSFNPKNDETSGRAFPLSQVSFLLGQYEFMVYLVLLCY